ncbi:PGF-pre-PGF domain-containing protein [uncultured Methanoregula sp.]|uniref:PGF-pre-PGF domain-containing protein n=1 Tax=uncultured Methanoregula sp. TaxID=1005933 RepID=UPI002AABB141|nr:PGF-pre-PGF domain-containing protein [uncultured Methanoregula sp.]
MFLTRIMRGGVSTNLRYRLLLFVILILIFLPAIPAVTAGELTTISGMSLPDISPLITPDHTGSGEIVRPANNTRQPAGIIAPRTDRNEADPFTVIDENLPPAEAVALRTLIQNTLHEFSCNEATGTWYARNAMNRITFTYTGDGTAHFSGPDTAFGLTLAGIGRDDNLSAAGSGVARASGRQLEIVRPEFSEWYRNNDNGVEQGLTITGRPPGNGPLQVRFGLTGNGSFTIKDDQTLTLSDTSGTPLFAYTGLHAFSAEGRQLPASLATDGTTLSWIVDDTGAVYPLTIDPVVVSVSAATARFTGSAIADDVGYSVAISSDGSRVIVGALENSTAGSEAGAAYIFKKPAAGWSGTTSTSSADATFTGGAAGDNFGTSVSFSSDGSRAIVGAYNNDTAGSEAGAAYLFDEPAAGWSGTTSASSATARFTGGAANDWFGSYVSLSSDGSRAMVGAYKNSTAGSNAGAAYLFDKPATGWSGTTSASSATARFTGGAANDWFGSYVSLSSDGSRAMVGAYKNSTAGSNAGAAYLFDKPATGWSGTTSASSATAQFTGSAANNWFGSYVSLSSDGSRAIVGAYYNDTAGSDSGAAYLFDIPTPMSGTISASSAAARFTGEATNDNFGNSVSLSSDGSRALVGAWHNRSTGLQAGAAYLFDEPATGWSGTTSASSATAQFNGGAASDWFGSSLSLSSDGSRALVGAYHNRTVGSQSGAAYLFQRPYVTLTAGGITTGAAGTVVNGLTLNPGSTLTNVDLFLGTSTTTPSGAAIKTGIPSLPASTATTIDGVDLTGKTAGTYYLIVNESSTKNLLGATGSAVYTVTGTTPTPTPTPAPQPIGGSGDDGWSSTKSAANPALKAPLQQPLSSSSVNIGQVGHTAFTRVDVTGVDVKDMIVTATEVPGPGTGIPPPPGIVYVYADISPARYTEITETKISFVVPLSWMNEHNLIPQEIVLFHNTGNTWVALATTLDSIRDGEAYYTAAGSGFSRFAITGQFNSSAQNATPSTTARMFGDLAPGSGTIAPTYAAPPAGPAPVASQTTAVPAPMNSSGFPLPAIAVVGAIGVICLCGAFMIRRWWIRRQNPALFRKDN